MFDRTAQVNARFAGGASESAAVVAALHKLGLGAAQIRVVEHADPGTWHEPAPAQGWLTRLKGRFGSALPVNAASPPPDLLILVYLGQDDTLAEPVQAVFRRFDAAQIDYYPAGKVATSATQAVDPSADGDAALFRAAFPEQEGRHPRPAAATADDTGEPV
jgi:hypothetical protein